MLSYLKFKLNNPFTAHSSGWLCREQLNFSLNFVTILVLKKSKIPKGKIHTQKKINNLKTPIVLY